MSAGFINAITLILVCQFVWNGVSSSGCPSRTLDVYFSAEQVPVLHAPNGDFSRTKQLPLDLRKVLSLALDYRKEHLLIPGWEIPNATYIFNVNSKRKLTFNQEREHFSEFAVDPITGNVYFISQHNIIGVCSMNFTNCVRLLHLDLDKRIKRRNLQIHPRKGLLIWVDDYVTTRVQMSDMSGGNVSPLVPHDDYVYAISLDAQHNILYIALPDKIETFNLETKERATFLDIKASHIYYFDCKLGVKPRETSKFSVYGIEDKTLIHTGTLYGNSFFIAANSDEKIPPNPCATVNCNGLCVISGKSSTKCVNDDSNKPKIKAAPQEFNLKSHWHYVVLAVLSFIIVAMIIPMCCINKKYNRIMMVLREIRIEKATPVIPINGFTDRHEF